MFLTYYVYRLWGIPEYCENFGIKFTEENFIEKLNEIYENYNFFTKK